MYYVKDDSYTKAIKMGSPNSYRFEDKKIPFEIPLGVQENYK